MLKLKAKLVSLLTVALFLAMVSLTTVNYLSNDSYQQTQKGILLNQVAGAVKVYVDDYKTKALEHSINLAANPAIIGAVKTRNRLQLLKVTTPLMKNGNLEYMVITDEKGNVLVRTHDPENYGDSIAKQENIIKAVSGTPFVGIEPGKVVKLSIRAGAPIKDETGKVIGALSTGYVFSQNSIVEKAKKLFGLESALFYGKERVATTLEVIPKKLGGAEVEQLLNNQLKEYRQDVSLNEEPFTVVQIPLIGADGKVIAIFYLAKSNQAVAALEKQNLINSLLITVVVLILAGLLVLLAARSILKPLDGVTAKLKDIAEGEGDLTARITVSSHDEIGQVALWFNKFVEKIQSTVSLVSQEAEKVTATSEGLSSNAEEASKATQQVAKSIEQVAKGSAEQSKNIEETVQVMEQVAQSIHQIAAGAGEQSKNVTGTTAEVEEMAKKIEVMAEGMETVKQLSEQNGIVAVNGGQAVDRTVQGMVQLKDSVFETAQKINKLGEYSHKIGEIIRVIDDIAEQTNLLALNAAIEAARAGEHGKGFAVVADEVRKLAERSGKATKEIADLITDIQKETKVAVESMQVGTREVEEGVTIAQEAGRSLEQIVNGVNAAGEHVQKIMGFINDILHSSREVSQAFNNVAAITEENTAATEEMAASSQQVNSSIQNVASISQENAAVAEEVSASTEELTASTEEISASAEQLAKMAQDLQQLVAKFRY